jgi:hypothetical protein
LNRRHAADAWSARLRSSLSTFDDHEPLAMATPLLALPERLRHPDAMRHGIVARFRAAARQVFRAPVGAYLRLCEPFARAVLRS